MAFMSKKFALLAVLGLFLVVTATVSAQPMPTGIECVEVPGIPCPGSRTGSGSSSHSGNMNSVIQQELAGALAESFFKLLFSSDAKAAAQKQQMMEELARRQAEAERLHKVEEAKRLQAICNRLVATLKLSGVPDLRLKDDGPSIGGLHLKLGEDTPGSTRTHNLPGIALNDTTGNGANTPYGIKGLPGIYINGPGSGSTGGAPPAEPKLQLKTGDENPAPTQLASDPGAASSTAVPAQGSIDLQNMSPQELADVATKISDLPPEEQQRLMAAAQKNAQIETSTPSQPVASQLQSVANASQSAATTNNLDDAAAKARVGFDQAANGGTLPTALPTAAPVPIPASSQTAPTATTGAASVTSSGTSVKPALVINLTSPSAGSVSNPVKSSVQKIETTARAGCPPGIERMIPSRQQLLTELAVRRSQLESLRGTILRLNRSIQLDQQQFAVWQDEAQAGLDRVKGHIWDLPTQFAFNTFVDQKEELYKDLEKKGLLTAFDKDQRRKLALAKDLKSFSDYKKWVMENKGDWEMIEDGTRQLIDSLPLKSGPMAYVRCAEDLIDNAYDLTDLVATWDNVQQLDHNSTQFLEVVRRNGERMKSLVERIQQIQTQLNSTPDRLPGASPCREIQATTKAP